MKKYILTFALLAVFCISCGEKKPTAADFKGVVINEIAAHDQAGEASWVEILNISEGEIDISQLGLYLFDAHFNGKQLSSFAGRKLSAGERLTVSTDDESLLTGIASGEDFTLVLGLSAKEAVDKFEWQSDIDIFKALPVAGSYQRIPDGSASWKFTLASSRGTQNVIHSLSDTKPNAIWLWSTHMGEWLDNDFALMKAMKAKGYDHVLLNFAAFDNKSNEKTAKEFIRAAADAGIVVHAWSQCFHSGANWVNPVDTEKKCYKQDVFDEIISKAAGYIDKFGVQGIHLDYVRYPGTAYKYSYPDGVSGEGAITEFCRQMKAALDKDYPGTILSAALMSETGGAYYYGQNYNDMSRYLDILMPMSYRYQENGTKYGNSWIEKMTSMFKNNAGGKMVWSGMQTYHYVSGNVKGNDSQTILSDAKDYKAASADGIVLFRYALGTFPDVNELW